jgi:ABC-2 type transport system permease protein
LVEPYLAVFSIGLKNTLAYKTDFVLSLFSSFFQAGLMIFIWTAIYDFTNTTSILGITLSTMYVYFFLLYAFRVVINFSVPEVMQEDIQNGSLAVAYTRPLKYPIQVFMSGLPDDALYAGIITIPLIIAALLLSHVLLTPLTIMLVISELLIGYTIVILIGFMIGMLAVKLTNIYGIMNSTWSVILLLGGGVLPLTLFPNAVYQILMLTPFPMLLYVPAATFLGMISTSVAIRSMFTGLFWIAVLLLVTIIAWRSVRKKITSAGG